jgi:putative hemolysin
VGQFLAAHASDLAVLASLLVVSAFFSGSETALFSLGAEGLDDLARRHPRPGAAVRAMLGRPDDLLASVLFGNLVVNTLYFSTSVTLGMAGERRWPGFAAATTVATLVAIIVFSEVLPKAVAAASPRALARFVAWPLWLFHNVAGRPARLGSRPLLALLDRLVRPRVHEALTVDELRMLVELARNSGSLSGSEAGLLDGVVALSELRIRQIMVPRVDVVVASVTDRPEQVLRRLSTTSRSRAPVYEGQPDNIIGIVEARKLVAACASPFGSQGDLRAHVRPVVFVPESAPVSSMIEQFRAAHAEAAVVVDEYGGTAGFVTLEDLAYAALEAVSAGSTAANEPAVECAGPGSYTLSGDLSVRAWSEIFGVEYEQAQFDTLGGLVTSLLGRIPEPGDVARWGNLRFTVREVSARRIVEVDLSLEGAQDPAAEAAR